MQSSELYKKLTEDTYIFDTYFEKLKETLRKAVKINPNLKSFKIMSTDPIVVEIKTDIKLSPEAAAEICKYINILGGGYSYSYDVEPEILRIKFNASYIKKNDKLGAPAMGEVFNDSLEEQDENSYRDYLEKHIKLVNDCFNKVKEIPKDEAFDILLDDRIIEQLDAIIEKHDESKWSEEEFEPYRKHYYPEDDSEKLNSEEFENAWIHHYTNNPHHWEYWCKLNPQTGKFELQPNINEDDYKIYTVERICDWCAMSRYFGNRLKDWYEENKDEIVQPEFINGFVLDLVELCDKYEIDKN